MWQAPNHRNRALQNKRRDRQKQRNTLHLKRVPAELRVSSAKLGAPAIVSMARIFLNDITAKGVGMFCSDPLVAGTIVAVTIEEPKRFFVRGRITWCQPLESGSAIISSDNSRYAYRAGIEFIFDNPGEEEEVKKFVAELAAQHVYGP